MITSLSVTARFPLQIFMEYRLFFYGMALIIVIARARRRVLSAGEIYNDLKLAKSIVKIEIIDEPVHYDRYTLLHI